ELRYLGHIVSADGIRPDPEKLRSVRDFPVPFKVKDLDASDCGLGAILAQKVLPEGDEHVIVYASRTLSETERKYYPTERECLAIIWGTQHFRPYLEGRPFEVWTDHKSLVWLRNLKDPTSRLARWGMKLHAYDMVIKHRSDAANQNVDTLSRYPVQSEVVASLQTKTLNDALQLSNDVKDRLTGINIWDSCSVL
ncbi:unnamed protein product, partial [Didymodactylos carnosus]